MASLDNNFENVCAKKEGTTNNLVEFDDDILLNKGGVDELLLRLRDRAPAEDRFEQLEKITYHDLVETCKTIYLEYEDEINFSIEHDDERYFAKLIRDMALSEYLARGENVR